MANFRNFLQTGGAFETEAFLESNSFIAKAAFITLILIVFIICLSFGSQTLKWLFSPSKNPKIINGMKRGRERLIVSSNPQKIGAIPILRSNDETQGVEFGWSVWIYINDLDYKKNERKHIFHKGANKLGENGLPTPNQAPGLYLHETNNSLIVVMNTFKGYGEEIVIDDMPLNKWLNVIIRVEGNIVDVYINGSIAVRHILNNVVKQNYGDTHVNLNGGFSGLISDLQYFSWAPSVSEILRIMNNGPNLNMIEDSTNSGLEVFPPYLSTRWYIS